MSFKLSLKWLGMLTVLFSVVVVPWALVVARLLG